MDPLAGGGPVVIVRAANLRGTSHAPDAPLYVEVTHEGITPAGQTRSTRCTASPFWNHTLTLPLSSLQQGQLKVLVCHGVPLAEEKLAELAFEGKQPPPPLGCVRVPVADLAGLERSRPYTLEGDSNTPSGSITLGFTVVEDNADANDSAEGGGQGAQDTEPHSVSGIFFTSDFSVDPPLPVHSSTQSEVSRSEEDEEGFGSGTVRRGRAPRPRSLHTSGVVERGTSSPGSSDGDRARADRTPRRSSSEGLESTAPSMPPATAVPPRLPGGGEGRDPKGRRATRGGGVRSDAGSGSTSGSACSQDSGRRVRSQGKGTPRCAPGVGPWARGSDEDKPHAFQGSPVVGNMRDNDGHPSEGSAGGVEGHDEDGSGADESDESDDLSPEGIAAVLRGLADAERKAEESTGGGSGRCDSATADSTGLGLRSKAFSSSGSSSNFELSSAYPLSTPGNLWGSREDSGSEGVRQSDDTSLGSNGSVSVQMGNTPQREAVERLEVLTATVAATVAEVAAETYEAGSIQNESFNSAEDDHYNDHDDDESSRSPLGGLPMAGSRSPRAATAAAIPRPGSREPDSETDQGHIRNPNRTPKRSSAAADSTSNDGFSGGLPLASLRSPPAGRLPGRRNLDSSGVNSSSVRPSMTARAAQLPTGNASPRQRRRRRQRRPEEEDERHNSFPTTAGTCAAAAASSPSGTPSAPPNLIAPRMSGPSPTSGGGGGGGGRRQRDAEYQAEDRLLRSRNRSEVSWWEKDNFTSDEDSGDGGARPGVSINRDGGVHGHERPQARKAESPLANTQRQTRRHPKTAVTAATASEKKHKQRSPPVVWRQVAGGTRTAAGAAGAAAARLQNPGPGLRSTHFAPGFLGVAWPDPFEEGAAVRQLNIARERLLTKIEEASSRKIAEVEERSLRARRERAERLTRRNTMLEKSVRREIQEAMEEQERRLQRQLEAARRRQAGVAAAAAAASAARSPAGETRTTTRGAAARERAEAVRRRRAMLEADKARAKIYAFKRRGELRTKAFLLGRVRGAATEEDVAAAAEAFEGVAAGTGVGATGGTGRGVVIASGAPRTTLESWNEQRRAKAEKIRLQGTMEKAFKALYNAAALRREHALGARRARARETNVKAAEGHGRARKRLRMQAETAAARVEARAKEAAAAAAAAEAEAAKRERARRRRDVKTKKKQGMLQQERRQRSKLGRRGSRAGRRGREEPRLRDGGPTARRVSPGRPSLVEVLGEARAVTDNGGEDENDGRSSDSSEALGERAKQPRGSRGGGVREEVWEPSTTRVGGTEAPRQADQTRGRQKSAWVGENAAVARRLAHLDNVAAKLEEAGAEIEANMDLLASKHGRSRTAANRHGVNDSPDYFQGREEHDNRLDLASGSRGARRRRDNKEGRDPARGRLEARGGVVSRRLVAPTASSINKVRPSAVGLGSSRGRGSSTPPRSLARHLGQTDVRNHDNISECYEGRAGPASLGWTRGVGDQETSGKYRDRSEKRSTRGERGCRHGMEQPGGSLSSSVEESPGQRPNGSPPLGLLLSSRNEDDSHDGGDRGFVRGVEEKKSEAMTRRRERHGAEEEKEDRRARGRTHRARSESNSLTSEGDNFGQGLLGESTRMRARYRREHKEAMESVSSDALRMRAIKDDLSEVLQRLREGDIPSAAGTTAAAAAAGGGAAGRPLPESGEQELRSGDDDDSEEELAAAFFGTPTPGRSAEKNREQQPSSRQHQVAGRSSFSPVAGAGTGTATTSMTLQVSALADLEARIASLGGLLNSFSTEDGGDTTSMQQQRHRRRFASSGGGEGAGEALLRQKSSPLPRELQQQVRPRSTSPVPLTLMRVQSSLPSSTLSSPRYNAGDSGHSGEGRGAFSASGSSLPASSSSVGGQGAGAGGGGITAEMAGVSSAASDLAREVDAILKASGSRSRSGGSGDRVANDALPRSSGAAASDGRKVHRSSFGSTAVSGAGEAGLEEKTEASSFWWGDLEGMADRLGALAAGRGTELRVEGRVRGGGGSGSSSSRELGSVSSRA